MHHHKTGDKEFCCCDTRGIVEVIELFILHLWMCLVLSSPVLIVAMTNPCMCACVHLQLGMLEEAIADCTQAIELDPGYIRAYQRRAKL